MNYPPPHLQPLQKNFTVFQKFFNYFIWSPFLRVKGSYSKARCASLRMGCLIPHGIIWTVMRKIQIWFWLDFCWRLVRVWNSESPPAMFLAGKSPVINITKQFLIISIVGDNFFSNKEYSTSLAKFVRIRLTHYSPVLLNYTFWKRQKTFRFWYFQRV